MFDFLGTGQFNLTLGKSFDPNSKKKGQKYFNVKNSNNSDFGLFGKDAKLEKKNDVYQIEMKHAKRPNITYEAEVDTNEEYDCVLLYDEETKTFTLERQTVQINILQRKLELPTAVPSISPVPTTLTTNIETPQETVVSTEDASLVADDFEFDISKDMDAILGSDIDDDKSDADSDSDVFEEVVAPVPIHPRSTVSPLSLPVTPSFPSSPVVPVNLVLPATPITNTTPGSQNGTSINGPPNPVKGKKRKLKMASAPIRHPGIASPLVTSSPIKSSNLSPHVPPPPPHNIPNNFKRLKTTHDDDKVMSDSNSSDSSDEEDSSSGSESGSTETGSSSGSESGTGSSSESDSSDDDDFDLLAADISNSLSKSGPSAPPSPTQQPHYVNTPSASSPSTFRRSPYDTHSTNNTPTPTTRTVTSGGGGPMSLRALFKDEEDEEGLSSSESDSSDD